jgi:S1-C subfamily serine protease
MRGLLLLLAMVAAGIAGAAGYRWFEDRERTGIAQLPASGRVPVDSVPLSRLTLSPLVDRVSDGVVNISVVQASPYENNPLLQDPFFRRYLGVPDEALAPRLSAGSGFVVDSGRGLVLTNLHVVRNASAIQVTAGERNHEARLLAVDRGNDLAVLQVRAGGLKQLPLGDSDRLRVGDYVVAIGNPFEVGKTVTAGIVSALGRGRGGSPAYVQTDAPINPGNSGGPLIDMKGEVIGINTAIVGPGGGNVGIGIAVPSNTARRLVETVIREGGG